MKVYDLTQELYDGMPMFPAPFYPTLKTEFLLRPETDKAHRYVGKCEISHHTGTHLDAPLHYNYGNDRTVDKAPVDTLVGDCLVVDMYGKGFAEGITAADLAEAVRGRPLRNKRLVIRTGYCDKQWGKPDYFSNAQYLTADAAQWIVDQGVVLVGFDFLTDKPGDAELPVHNTLLKNGVYILEYMVNLEQLPSECTLVVAPLKLKNMEAAPCRVYALVL